MKKNSLSILLIVLVATAVYVQNKRSAGANKLFDPELHYSKYIPNGKERVISRSKYMDQLQGFWLAQCIANWTGLITEMDKVGPPFYMDKHWGGPDQRNIWGNFVPHADTINFYFVDEGEPWGADDDTDIEYMYQHLLDINNTSLLSGKQIKNGWLHHIYSNEDAPNGENFLWVSNETAYYLMQEGLQPPATSEPEHNPDHEMIDAQLTTEIFGLFAPARPDVALRMAHLPIRTTAKNNAEWAAEFYVIMHALASYADNKLSMKKKVFWLAEQAREHLPDESYVAGMVDFIKAEYERNPDKNNWEVTRDAVYERYQEGGSDGYVYNQPFDAGINFSAGLISLFYGEGDLARTIRIGSLTGWDSDNPTATWGGLIGFILGRKGVEKAFEKTGLSDTYWISRTRRNFPDRTPDEAGDDTFQLMAERAIYIIDRVVMEEMSGGVDLEKDVWYIPDLGGSY
ncbi:MAG TPA: ADP-ribosylglycohydrolase family protein [Candidatus Marinimicrobia bacterium]|nr:ADP-ribosylglycohydrolase family protein [Candidatus Neomarinimicrobiota bacterium]